MWLKKNEKSEDGNATHSYQRDANSAKPYCEEVERRASFWKKKDIVIAAILALFVNGQRCENSLDFQCILELRGKYLFLINKVNRRKVSKIFNKLPLLFYLLEVLRKLQGLSNVYWETRFPVLIPAGDSPRRPSSERFCPEEMGLYALCQYNTLISSQNIKHVSFKSRAPPSSSTSLQPRFT